MLKDVHLSKTVEWQWHLPMKTDKSIQLKLELCNAAMLSQQHVRERSVESPPISEHPFWAHQKDIMPHSLSTCRQQRRLNDILGAQNWGGSPCLSFQFLCIVITYGCETNTDKTKIYLISWACFHSFCLSLCNENKKAHHLVGSEAPFKPPEHTSKLAESHQAQGTKLKCTLFNEFLH